MAAETSAAATLEHDASNPFLNPPASLVAATNCGNPFLGTLAASPAATAGSNPFLLEYSARGTAAPPPATPEIVPADATSPAGATVDSAVIFTPGQLRQRMAARLAADAAAEASETASNSGGGSGGSISKQQKHPAPLQRLAPPITALQRRSTQPAVGSMIKSLSASLRASSSRGRSGSSDRLGGGAIAATAAASANTPPADTASSARAELLAGGTTLAERRAKALPQASPLQQATPPKDKSSPRAKRHGGAAVWRRRSVAGGHALQQLGRPPAESAGW